MKRKIIGIVFCMLLLVTFFLPVNVIAGDEENPEITDDIEDVLRIPVHNKWLNARLNAIDIVSVWFAENTASNQSHTFYVIIKVMDYKNQLLLRTIHSVHWSYNGTNYYADLQVQFMLHGLLEVLTNTPYAFGPYGYFRATVGIDGTSEVNTIYPVFGNNTISFVIPKELVGNPKQGDTLTHIWSECAMSFSGNAIIKLIKDYAPNDTQYGKDYTIQY